MGEEILGHWGIAETIIFSAFSALIFSVLMMVCAYVWCKLSGEDPFDIPRG